MNFPLYIYYEILIRLAEIGPNVGEYLSYKHDGDDYLIRTTTGELLVARAVLSKQFEDPNLLSIHELVQLAATFKVRNHVYDGY